MVGTATNVLQATHISLGLILIVLTWLISSSLNSRVKIITIFLVAFNPSMWAMAALAGYEVLLGVVLVSATLFTWQIFMPIEWLKSGGGSATKDTCPNFRFFSRDCSDDSEQSLHPRFSLCHLLVQKFLASSNLRYLGCSFGLATVEHMQLFCTGVN